MREYKGNRALVIGLARSGLAAAKLLTRLGAKVTITDMKTAEQLGDLLEGLPPEVTMALGGHEGLNLTDFDLAVISPGVPWEAPLPTALRNEGIELISELELAYTRISAPIIAVTGSNGKSTTTSLIGEILKAWGRKVYIGGNIGAPLCDAADEEYDFIVAEVSSFQLEGVATFHPKVALLLNITPDHLDRHGDMERYTSLKVRVFENQGEGDIAILNAVDERTRNIKTDPDVCVIHFSPTKMSNEGAWVEENVAMASWSRKIIELFNTNDLNMAGLHNLENALAASLAALVVGVDQASMRSVLKTFGGLPHRMERVAEHGGVVFYNDSKATNPDAVIKSLAGFNKNVALIAGGSSKSSNFDSMTQAIFNHAKGVVLIGETSDEIEAALGIYQPKVRAASLEEAVSIAANWCGPGDVVMLSPGCASFDMFKSFEHRGDCFRDLVNSYLGMVG